VRSCASPVQIPVERNSAVKTSEPLEAARILTSQGSGLIVYPEGTLTKDENLWPMRGKLGAMRMALQSDIPLFPAAHWGTHKLMGRYSKKITVIPRSRIHVIVGEQMDLSAYRGKPLTTELLEEATEDLMRRIAALVGELRGEKPPPRFMTVGEKRFGDEKSSRVGCGVVGHHVCESSC